MGSSLLSGRRFRWRNKRLGAPDVGMLTELTEVHKQRQLDIPTAFTDYRCMTDGSSRYHMQQSIEKQRILESEGWTTQAGDPTEEQLENAWSNIK